MLDLAYARAAAGRRRWYERHPEARRRLGRPVISVGNLSVGGTGKTPLVGAIAEWLLSRGERPSVLSRGYRRLDPVDGVVVVSDGRSVCADVRRSGDEPYMIATSVPGAVVCVAEDRHIAGALAERRLGATIHLLDDGFQHLHLARDFDILLTAPGEIAGGRVLPRGRLREAPDAAARAHFLVVVDADRSTARSEAWELGISQFACARREVARADAGDSRRAVALAGIAVPGRFFTALREAGYTLAETIAYPDHHPYSDSDVARISAAVESTGAEIVLTTAKDLVRLQMFERLPFAVAAVPLRLAIDEGWDALTASIVEVIGRRREAA